MISIISLVLALLKIVEAEAIKNQLADNVISGIQGAIAELEKVRGSEVTYQQLESLRTEPKW